MNETFWKFPRSARYFLLFGFWFLGLPLFFLFTTWLFSAVAMLGLNDFQFLQTFVFPFFLSFLTFSFTLLTFFLLFNVSLFIFQSSRISNCAYSLYLAFLSFLLSFVLTTRDKITGKPFHMVETSGWKEGRALPYLSTICFPSALLLRLDSQTL